MDVKLVSKFEVGDPVYFEVDSYNYSRLEYNLCVKVPVINRSTKRCFAGVVKNVLFLSEYGGFIYLVEVVAEKDYDEIKAGTTMVMRWIEEKMLYERDE